MKKAAAALKILLLVIATVMPSLLLAQDIPEFPDQVDDVPFDGGVSLLVAAGIAYGLKKVWEKKRPEKI